MSLIQNLRDRQVRIKNIAKDEVYLGHTGNAARLYDGLYKVKFKEYITYFKMYQKAQKEMKQDPENYQYHKDLASHLAVLIKITNKDLINFANKQLTGKILSWPYQKPL